MKLDDILHSSLFATPESYGALENEIRSLPREEQAIAYKYVMLSSNLAYKIIKEIVKEEV
ncbi:hypothetical protein EBT31_09780 [bacterium]|nr:hypothetical protein [bacterium]